MRLSAIAVCIFFASNEINASTFQQPQPRSRSAWGIIDYGGAADSTLPSSNHDTDEVSDNDTTDRKINTNIEKFTSSQLLNSVSAGGGSPSDHVTAFVGSTATTTVNSAMASTAMLKRPSSTLSGPTAEMISPLVGESSSSSSLSVASNTQKDVEVIASSRDAETDGNSTTTIEQQQQRPLKILFLSSDTGGGHRASAEALAAQFQRLFPGSTYDLFDVWTDVESSWPYYTIKDTYKSFSATPWKWRALYHVSNNAVYAKLADLHSYYMNEDLITAKMEEYNPDVIGEKMIDSVLNSLLYACNVDFWSWNV
jgi:hypothetical protein